MNRRTLKTTIAALTLTLAAGAVADLSAEPLRLLAWDDRPECRCTADLSQRLPLAVEEAAAHFDVAIELETVARAALLERLNELAMAENLPDLVWVSHERIGDLYRSEQFAPLDEFIAGRPWLLEGFGDEALQGFRCDGMLMALPLDAAGELGGIGQALTWAAVERGRVEPALEIAGFLGERLPPRPIPDLVASMSLDRDDLLEDDRALMVGEVVNAGDAYSDGVPMHFCVDNELVAERWIDPLAPGEQTVVEATIQLPPAGEHVFSGRLHTATMFDEANRHNDCGAMGQLVQPVGGGVPPSPKPKTGIFTLHGAAFHTRLDSHRHVRVAFDGSNFLVAWIVEEPLFTKTGTRRIVATRVTPAGVVLDPLTIPITTWKDRFESFDLAFDGQRYIVVWERLMANPLSSAGSTLPNPYSRIEGMRISTGGILLDSTPIVIEAQPCSTCPVNWSTWQYRAPQVASTSNGFLVTYRRRLTGGTQWEDRLVGRFVTGGGTVRPGRKVLMNLTNACRPHEGQSLAFNASRGEGVLVFDAYDYSATTQKKEKIIAIWLKLQGSVLTASPPKTVVSIVSQPWDRVDRPEVAAAPDGTFFGAFESDAGKAPNAWPDIHGFRLGTYGSQSVHYQGAIVKGSLEMQPAIDWDGQHYGIAFTHGGCSPVPGVVRVTAGGSVGSRSIPFKNIGSAQDVDIAFGAGRGLVVFTRECSGSNKPSTYKYRVEAFFIK